jgi:alkane 1-monooxygenase
MDTIANSTVPAGSTEQWRDPKRYLWLIGLVVPSLFFVGYGGWAATGAQQWSGLWFWVGPVVVLVVVPLIDLVAGLDRSNPPDDVIEALENDRYYRWITYLFLPIQYVAFPAAMYLIVEGDPFFGGGELALWEKVGLAISIGVIGGIGINTAHELGHKKESHERWLSKIALAQVFYGHFYIEHNRGHHVRVATPEDPASARFGENFWEFLPRTVWGALKSSVELEAQRIRRLGRSPWDPRTYLKNDVLNAWLMSVVFFGILIAVFGPALIPFVLIQGIYGFSLLESVNYLEHYGLLRQKTESGRYERCAPVHSWNSDHIVTNLFLYHLQRHSDHHANPTRRYQTLRSIDGAPNLPSGYATLIGLTYIPPLWRRMMDHRVIEHYDGDITKVNVHPRVRDKVLAKYGAVA